MNAMRWKSATVAFFHGDIMPQKCPSFLWSEKCKVAGESEDQPDKIIEHTGAEVK